MTRDEAQSFGKQVKIYVDQRFAAHRLAPSEARQASIGNVSFDLAGLVDAVTGLPVKDYSSRFAELSERIGMLIAAVDAQTVAVVAQTAAIADQTATIADQTRTLAAVAKSDRTVTYDSSGRVTKIKVG